MLLAKRTPKGLSSRASFGFSLPELLVVIAIIALVVAIIIPAVSAIRARARTMKCLTNQRTITMANYAYAMDNSSKWASPRTDPKGLVLEGGLDYDMAPQGSSFWGYDWPATARGPTPAASPPRLHCWVRAIPDAGANAINPPPAQQPYVMNGAYETTRALEEGVLSSYIDDRGAYFSPDELPKSIVGSQTINGQTIEVVRRSYSMNACLGTTRPDELGEFDDDFMSTIGPMGGAATPIERFNTTSVASIKQPQRMMSTIVEDDDVAYNNQGWLVMPQTPNWIDWPAPWRPDAITLSYVDGSTETYELKVRGLLRAWEQFGHRYQQPTSFNAADPNHPGDPNSLDWRFFRDRLNPGVLPNSTMGFGN
jgi:prepilin-type N-terminal cleavage/methylation domain-containing protein